MNKEKDNRYPQESIVVITLDSLRYDVAMKAKTPNLNSLFELTVSKKWVKVGSHGTYSLPSHISMFHSGMFPCDNRERVMAPFNRDKEKLFKAQLKWERTTKAKFPTPAAENVVKGFEKLGYRTVGIGGVHWFNDDFLTSKIWGKYYFKEFYWDKRFSENDFKSIDNQIRLIESLELRKGKDPLFFFLNISVTHKPYLGHGESKEGQRKALEEFDQKIPKLLSVLPSKYHLLILSDHGECFGENGLWGHGFYHPKVMEIPFNYGFIKSKDIQDLDL